jgi:hypothetical protein
MRSSLYISFLAALTLTASCQKLSAEQHMGSSDAQTSVLHHAPLPVRGIFRTSEVWGFTEDDRGERKPLHAVIDDLDERVWTARFDLDSSGAGIIEGMEKCTGVAGTNSTPNSIRPHQALNVLFGIMGAVGFVSRTVADVQCLTASDGIVRNMVPSNPRRNLFGKNITEFSKNLGFVGEGVSMSAADNECKRLRGWRHVNILGAETCIGFRDAHAKKIRVIVIRPGEIHPIRVDMVRK